MKKLASVPGVTPQYLRQTLGIVEYDHDNWDDVDNDHDGDPVEPHTQQRTQTVGLRPSGRIEPRQKKNLFYVDDNTMGKAGLLWSQWNVHSAWSNDNEYAKTIYSFERSLEQRNGP